MIKVLKNGATVADYLYNALNQRVSKKIGATTTLFLYDFDGNLIAEAGANGAITAEYLYMSGNRLAMVDTASDKIYTYLNDRLGTPRLMTDATNTVIWEAMYKPFGEATVNPKSSVVSNFRFAGQYYDAETGLHYNWHRYYDPATGRYLTPDPIGLEGGMNLYEYVRNNPINKIDPLGLIEYPDNFIGPLPEDGYRTSEMTQTNCGRIPPAPTGTDINKNLQQANNSSNPSWFYDQVRNNGPWDYKQRGRKYEDFGNFNFGATGSAFGFPNSVLLRGAGWANQQADPTRTNLGSPWGRYPYGDDYNDQEQIKAGISYCECMGY